MNYIHCNENAIYYECGYSNDNSIYLSLGSESYFVTDSRYTLEAKSTLDKTSPKTSLVIGFDLVDSVVKLISKSKIKQVSFDSKEWDYYRIAQIQQRTKAKWITKLDMSRKKRIVKSAKEIKLLKKAVKLGANAFDEFAVNINSSGIGKTEKELFFMAQSAMSCMGQYALSFDPIVAINANTAKPHAHPTDLKLKKGDLLLYDAGLKYKRYCSDRTRTVQVQDGFIFENRQKHKSKNLQRAYDAVLKAHDKAIRKAKSGMRACQVDAICRDSIDKAGFGKYFIHSTGHGVGLDIHELPVISSRSRTKIKDGMVYTIEPGIYIPDQFGIRIEDMVVMRDGRADIL